MATDLTVGLANRPGTLLGASDALARAGINIEGACGYLCDERGLFHVLVDDRERARRALLDAGFVIEAERPVAVIAVENRPGSAADVLRRVAEAEANIELLYMTGDGRLVLGGADVPAIRHALQQGAAPPAP
jgi:hypothetical protein